MKKISKKLIPKLALKKKTIISFDKEKLAALKGGEDNKVGSLGNPCNISTRPICG
jgi:hypothetical protein